ncbi:MAG: RluA family pseudouridine synthase [Granulosicoccus sp.]
MHEPEKNRSDELSRGYTSRIGEQEAGQRVDNYLMRRSPGVPKSHIYQLIRKGQVRVDGRRVKPDRKLQAGEQVRIPPMRLIKRETVRVPDEVATMLAEAVVVDHPDFLVIAKPPGMAVHGGTGIVFGVIDALRQQFGEPGLELVHRLDRGTSGCLLIARDLKRCRQLQAEFRERRVEKRYTALVAGCWPAQITKVDAALKKNVEHAGERRVQVDPLGLQAVSHFSVVQRLRNATLVDVRIDTGRTHQIRVHALHSGHPVVGDTRYGNNQSNAQFKRYGLARLYLHARQLKFDWQGERTIVDVPPDESWQAAVGSLGQ